jgi:pimeloyl-ACP methyl ester carboxylesterase
VCGKPRVLLVRGELSNLSATWKGLVVIGHSALLALSLVASPPVESSPSISPAEFRASFDSALAGKLSVPANIKLAARSFRYVFVGGFMNEGMSEYFKQNARELRAIGVTRKAVHYIYPSSHETIEANAASVCGKFQEFAALGPEKLVVIAHSRGACDALAFALQNPQFVSDHIQALFLIQGPFGGTGVADYLIGEGPPIDKRMPLKHRLIALALGRLEEYVLSRGMHGGLSSLTRRASKEFWEAALEEYEAALPVVSPKTFYVTAKTRPAHLRLFLQATAWYLGTNFGPNDGMVALEDQSVAGVGTVLAVLDAGHTDLTHRFPSALPKRRLRRGLIDAIIMCVGRATAA